MSADQNNFSVVKQQDEELEKIDFVLPAELKHILLFELHFEPLQDQFLKYQFELENYRKQRYNNPHEPYALGGNYV